MIITISFIEYPEFTNKIRVLSGDNGLIIEDDFVMPYLLDEDIEVYLTDAIDSSFEFLYRYIKELSR